MVDFVGESEGAEGGASGLGGGDEGCADVVEDLRLDEGAGVMVLVDMAGRDGLVP